MTNEDLEGGISRESAADFDRTFAVFEHGDGYAGIGWYYWDENYPEEGSVGAFATREEAEAHARDGDYAIKS